MSRTEFYFLNWTSFLRFLQTENIGFIRIFDFHVIYEKKTVFDQFLHHSIPNRYYFWSNLICRRPFFAPLTQKKNSRPYSRRMTVSGCVSSHKINQFRPYAFRNTYDSVLNHKNFLRMSFKRPFAISLLC